MRDGRPQSSDASDGSRRLFEAMRNRIAHSLHPLINRFFLGFASKRYTTKPFYFSYLGRLRINEVQEIKFD